MSYNYLVKHKKISTALVSAAVGGSIGVAVVAQNCASPTPEDNSNLDLLQSTLVSLSQVSTPPAAGTSGGFVFAQLLSNLRGLDSSITEVNSIAISNSSTTITQGAIEQIVQINAGALTIEVSGGTFSTYTNTSVLRISNITSENGTINGLTIPSNSFEASVTNSEFLRNTFVDLMMGLNGDANPENANELAIYTALSNQINAISDDTTHQTITSISLSLPADEVRDAIQVSEDATQITIARGLITITTDGTVASIFENSNADLVISNLIVNNGVINISNDAVTGLDAVYTASQVITGAIRMLNGITTAPAVDTNSFVFYQTFLTALQRIDSNISDITNIEISNIQGFIFTNTDNRSATISPDSMTFTTVGGTYSTYSNVGQEIVIADIQVSITTGRVINTPTVNGPTVTIFSQPTNEEIVINTIANLNNRTARPPGGAGLLWDAIQSNLRVIDGNNQSLTIQRIEIINAAVPSNVIFTNSNANLAGILQNSIFVTTSGGTETNNFTNFFEELAITNIVIQNDAINAIGSISGFSAAATPQENIISFGSALSEINGQPTNASLSVLYNTLLNYLRLQDGTITEINSISVLAPPSAATDTTMTFLQNSLSINTDSAIIQNYVNSTADFTFDLTLNSGGDLIETAVVSTSTSSILVSNPTQSEIIRNAVVDLNGATTRPVNNASSALLYDSIVAILTTLNNNVTITQVNSLIINDPVTSLSINSTATGAFLDVDSLRIVATDTNGAIIEFVNIISEVLLTGITFSNDEITSLSEITGIEIAPTTEVLSVNAMSSLNGAIAPPVVSNSLVLWEAIEASIQQSNPQVENITSIVIDDPASNISFTEGGGGATVDQISVAANAITVHYSSYLAPGVFVNTSQYNVNINVLAGQISVLNSSASFEINFFSNNEILEFAWNELIFATETQLNNLSGNALILANAMDARIQEITNLPVATRVSYGRVIAPTFSDTRIIWQPGTLSYIFRFDVGGVDYRASSSPSISSLVSLDNITFTNGNIDIPSNADWTNNFNVAMQGS